MVHQGSSKSKCHVYHTRQELQLPSTTCLEASAPSLLSDIGLRSEFWPLDQVQEPWIIQLKSQQLHTLPVFCHTLTRFPLQYWVTSHRNVSRNPSIMDYYIFKKASHRRWRKRSFYTTVWSGHTPTALAWALDLQVREAFLLAQPISKQNLD